MLKPFRLHNVSLIRRLSDQSISLRAESALTGSGHPLRGALTSLWVSGANPTFVWKDSSGETVGFAQLRVEEDNPHAQIVWLGLDGWDRAMGETTTDLEDAWLSLLEHIIVESGRRGLHSLTAEVDEQGHELPLLRRTGFAIYTRQDIFAATRPGPASSLKLAPRRPVDDWDIQLLYANTVPRLLQQVEPAPPLLYGESWLLRRHDDLVAFVHLYDGPAAAWLRLYVQPDAQLNADEIAAAALALKEPTPEHPVYCCVRRYQGWLRGPLERVGFHYWGSQVVLVKHTVQHSQDEMVEMPVALEAQGVPGSTTVMQPLRRYQTAGKALRRDMIRG